MSVFHFNRAIVRIPGTSVIAGLHSGNASAPTFDGINCEHQAYCKALHNAGLAITTLPACENYPDSLFVEDPALVFPRGAILLRSAASSRAGEGALLAPTLRNAFDYVLSLHSGHVDGGDVLVTPDKVIIGLSTRTNLEGAEALQRCLAELGKKSSIAHTPEEALHFKTACTLLDEETVLATQSLAACDVFAGFKILTVPEDEIAAANALRINDVVLAGASHLRTLDLLDGNGFNVVPLATDEIGKIDAGLTCMSLRWNVDE